MRQKFLLYLCRSRSLAPDSGLSMLEVLVAMMVVFLTFMTALNGLLYATLFQVKAEKQAQAVYWIQQDLERVKSEANSLDTFRTDVNATTPLKPLIAASKASFNNFYTAAPTSGNFLNGFARLMRDKLDDTETKTDPSTTSPTNTQDVIKFQNTADKNMFTVTSINATPTVTTPPTNPAQIQVVKLPNSTLLGKTYRMVRIIEQDDAFPTILKITYRVGIPDDSQTTYSPKANPPIIPQLQTDANGTSTLATLYTEILPSAALSP